MYGSILKEEKTTFVIQYCFKSGYFLAEYFFVLFSFTFRPIFRAVGTRQQNGFLQFRFHIFSLSTLDSKTLTEAF